MRREDPFIFCDDNINELQGEMAKHYGVDATFPFSNLLIRTHKSEKKSGIYFVNDRLRQFLKNNAERVKIVNAGIGVLKRTEKFAPCSFRLKQDVSYFTTYE